MSSLSLNLPHYSGVTPRFSPRHAFQIREFRVFRRRRLKLAPRSQLGGGIPFHEFISQFPSPSSLEFIAPVLGIVSGAALFLANNSNSSPGSKPVEWKSDSDIGEWVLFTSPTPFNRFVLLRCPSVSFQGSELLEDVNEKLVKEDRHFVRSSSGRIRFDSGSEAGSFLEEKLEYQRLCISTDDGGVISLDWPANLDLREEHGLDTTLVLVPGSSMGSLDWSVRSFVCEALRRGCFPIVMNPRGCAGSPLTTPRLFSAADSDDISTAIQFITKARPWTTLMGVGWGYGANMLTKYLAEAGESTPLTAATCIDNPFDLEEATRSSPHQMAIDENLTDGLIDILRSNKELFQGKSKGFDVEQALSAKSVRDFDKAISIVSYGYEAIEDFYSKSSTRGVIGNVKIPVLFIQKNDGSAPLFSVPRSLIAENPFTSLLLCSYLPSSVMDGGRSAVSWCQHLTIEWLTAVELGLLKGRHPLLKDVDLPIDPSEGLSLVEGRLSNNSGAKLVDLAQSDSLNGNTAGPANSMPEENDNAASFWVRSRKDSLRKSEVQNTGLQCVENGSPDQTKSDDQELVNEEEVSPVGEKGQVLQTAEVVMNMLDVTMPDTLTEEKKKKVLAAVDQGDTLMKALQDAVPEDVRGKLTSAVSGALHTQGTNLKFDQLLGVARIPDMSSGLKSKIEDKVMGTSSSEGVQKDNRSSDLLKKDDLVDSSTNELPDANKRPGGLESEDPPSEGSEDPPSEGSEKISNLDQSQSLSSQESDISDSVGKDTSESGNNSSKEKAPEDLSNSEKFLNLDQSQSLSSQESDISDSVGKDTSQSGNDKSSKEKAPEDLSNSEKGSELETTPNNSSQAEIVGGTEEAIVEEQKDQDGRITPLDTKKEEDNDNQKKDNKNVQPVVDQSKNFSVSEALNALTGMDDNTQMAVNNVFGVIENIITQMEESSHESVVKEDDSVSESESAKDHVSHVSSQEDSEASKTDKNVQMDMLSNVLVSDHPENGADLQNDAPNGWVEKSNQSPSSAYGIGLNSSQGSDAVNSVGDDKNEKKDQLVGTNLLAGSVDKLNHVKKPPLSVTSIPYGVNTLVSKVPDESLDLDSTAALLLDYFPEEGQWKLLEQPGQVESSVGNVATHRGVDRNIHTHSPAKVNGKVIEPSYVILDTEKHQEPVKEYETVENIEGRVEIGEEKIEEFMQFVKNIVLHTLKIEVGRRISADDMKRMEPYLYKEMEKVANAVSFDVGHDKYAPCLEVDYHSIIDCTTEKVGTLHGEHIIRAISSAVQGTSHLRRVLPVGVIVGSSLAALRKYFDVVTIHNYGRIEALTLSRAKVSGKKDLGKASGTEIHHMPVDKSDQNASVDSSVNREGEKTGLKNINNSVMVGAVTAALGASALFVNHQDSYKGDETSGESLSKSLVKGKGQKEPDKFEEAEKNQSNIVTSLAEKAMSVAAPVVPTKEGGEVDQERLVAMLADLGQRGGMLRLVGKAALLWGGLRGAMSLTDKLIQFLHIAERPLIQRIFGFVGMVLVLWSPIIIPLLPSFLQSWATNTSSRFAELACIVGLYTAFMILVVIWGKRIRGYENPLHRYGLDLTSFAKLGDFLKGLIGGVVLVLSIHSVSALLGCVNLAWPSTPSSLDAVARLKVYTQGLMTVGQGVVVATGIGLVEELLFRAWLPQEIAADLGYHRGIIISGLVFALSQRSPLSVPGLWLLSLSLAGARQRSEGSLAIPIGLRAGIIASSFIIQRGGFLTYRANFLPWIMGTQPFQPFSGLIGFAVTLVLALVLYPTQPLRKENVERTIEEFKKQHGGE